MISRVFLAALAAAAMVAGTAATSATIRHDEPQAIQFSSMYFTSPGTLLDFDGDGVDDLRLRGYSYWSSGRRSSSSGSNLTASGLNGAVVSSGPMLAEGASIDASGVYGTDARLVSRYSYSSRSCSFWSCRTRSGTNYTGVWSDGTARNYDGFLGLRLGDGSYGWAHLVLNANGAGQVRAYGYETRPGAAVTAGAETVLDATVPLPATAWMLLGGLGLLTGARRLRRRA